MIPMVIALPLISDGRGNLITKKHHAALPVKYRCGGAFGAGARKSARISVLACGPRRVRVGRRVGRGAFGCTDTRALDAARPGARVRLADLVLVQQRPGSARGIVFVTVEAVVEITGLRNPCAQLDHFQPGLMAAMLGRDEAGGLIRKSGVMAIVLQGGVLRAGDPIMVIPPAGPHRPLQPV
jgi:hypothetical protein